ncbi:MAG: DUF4270 domain-containing protein [Bacteroidaceae bacterium]|nr:DUF4270 domain-containing protein [Bacteroidaceae bacterium]
MHSILSKGSMLALAALTFAACDDSTGNLGIYPVTDGITNSTAIYDIITQSIKMDSVVANSTKNYVGCINDPETGIDISADFAAQFYTQENYKFPNKSLMIGEDENGDRKHGIVQCDSCDVSLYFEKYYGDEDNPMKLEVYELSGDSDKILSEDSVYYTDLDLTQFLADGTKPFASRVFTPHDFNLESTTLSSKNYSQHVSVSLPKSFGQKIMDKYYEDPDNFKDSYHFIRKVFPGFYFKTSGGKGTMLSVHVGTVNLYYRIGDEYDQDTVYSAMTRFASTPEVIQSTHFDNENLSALLADNSCTYLKTPAGICTEMTLPIDEVFSGEHATDSLSMASITLTRYNKDQDKYQLGTPDELLMVRKKDMYSFFLEHQVADKRTSYTTSFTSSDNSYSFSNICRLISFCKHEKTEAMLQANKERKEAGLAEYTDAEWDTQWQTQNPEWNKVVIIPVVTSNATVQNNGTSVNTQVSVTHDLDLNSIKLVGGSTRIKMQVVYSKFYHE